MTIIFNHVHHHYKSSGNNNYIIILLLQISFKMSKGSDWIRLVFAHPFPLNSGAPIMATYRVASSCTLIMELAQLMGVPLFKTNGWAQSYCSSSQNLSKVTSTLNGNP